MADENKESQESLEIKTPVGPIRVTGALAIFAILCVVVAYMLYEQYRDIKNMIANNHTILLQQNKDRANEHDRQMEWLRFVDCRMSLDIWVHTQPQGKELYFNSIPEGYRYCFPQLLEGKEIKR